MEMRRFSLTESMGVKPKVYASQLLDIKDERNLSIAVPIENGHLVPLEIGERYDVSFITSAGIYVCTVVIKNRFKQNTLYFLAVEVVSDLKKEQRRQYFRLEKIRPFEYHQLADTEDELLKALMEKRYSSDEERRQIAAGLRDFKAVETSAIMVNISGGGMKFQSDEELKREALIRIRLLLDDTDPAPYDLFARIIFTERIYNKEKRYEHRCEFININRDTRESIVRYIFNEERKQRKRENGM